MVRFDDADPELTPSAYRTRKAPARPGRPLFKPSFRLPPLRLLIPLALYGLFVLWVVISGLVHAQHLADGLPGRVPPSFYTEHTILLALDLWALFAAGLFGLIARNPFGWLNGKRLIFGCMAFAMMLGRPAAWTLTYFFLQWSIPAALSFVIWPVLLLATGVTVILTISFLVGLLFAFFVGVPVILFNQVFEFEKSLAIFRYRANGLAGYIVRAVLWLRNERLPAAPPDDSKGARLATFDEIRKLYNAAPESMGFGQLGKQPLFLKTDKHVLVMASTRSGKGVALLIPHLLRYQGSAFVLDPKGENARATGRRRGQLNGTVHYLDPFGISGKPPSRFNPFSRFTRDNMEAESKALADALFLVSDRERDHWTASGQQLLAALILYVYVTEDIPASDKDLPHVRQLLLGAIDITLARMVSRTGPVKRRKPKPAPPPEQQAAAAAPHPRQPSTEVGFPSKPGAVQAFRPPEQAKAEPQAAAKDEKAPTSAEAAAPPSAKPSEDEWEDVWPQLEPVDELLRDVATSFLSTPERERGSIISTAQRQTEILDNPYIVACLSATGPEPEVDFGAWHSGTMTVFLCLSAPKFPTFNRWLRLVLTSALDEMTDRLDPPKLPVCFMLDELATLGHLATVENAVGLAAGYGIQLVTVFQDVAQMRDLYKGRWASFIGNSGVRAIFNLDDYDTAEYWSKFAGRRLVQTQSRNVDLYGYSKGENIGETERALLSPEQLMFEFASGKMLVLAQGAHPIVTDRVPYYEDTGLKGLWDDPRTKQPPRPAPARRRPPRDTPGANGAAGPAGPGPQAPPPGGGGPAPSSGPGSPQKPPTASPAPSRPPSPPKAQPRTDQAPPEARSAQAAGSERSESPATPRRRERTEEPRDAGRNGVFQSSYGATIRTQNDATSRGTTSWYRSGIGTSQIADEAVREQQEEKGTTDNGRAGGRDTGDDHDR